MTATNTAKQADQRWDIKPGDTVKVHQVIQEKNAKGEEKSRIQIFEGVVLAHRHGQEVGATITVRKISEGIGIEKIFPLHAPMVSKVEIIKHAAVRRAKLTYLRGSTKQMRDLR